MAQRAVNKPKRVQTLLPSSELFLVGDLASRLDSLHDIVKQLIVAVTELQNRQFGSRELEGNLPKHGSLSELVDGIFLEITQETAAPSTVTIEHGLDRVPQGCIIIQSAAHIQILVDGDLASGIAPATREQVTFRLNGSVGDKSRVLVF